MKEVNFMNDVLPLKDKLFRLAWRITLNRAEAEDIVQDTLVRAWDQREEWSAIRDPETFCLTVCRNLALDRSKRAVHLPLPEQEQEPPDSQPAPDEALSGNERLRMARAAMDELPEVQRAIMELRDIEGMTYQEIAKTLCVTETQVKVYLHRARTKIKTRIKEMDDYGL
ncbi:MAG: sigma-70 family RNA polymerase sigma factor [Prevotellaceae bacterium]|nr:sigma-70 family RNA polymerase sigma factor [Prevotellaceae bacterium]